MERLERFTKVFTNFMGGTGSKLEKVLGDSFPEGERYFGLENFGNTCYCNSVLQVLYFCLPFREHLLEYYNDHQPANESEESLLTCLAELFNQINSQKRRTGVIAPKRFVQRVKKQKELFRSYMHQDAHEFLNFLLNELVDILEKERKEQEKEAEEEEEEEKRKSEGSGAARPLLPNGEGPGATETPGLPEDPGTEAEGEREGEDARGRDKGEEAAAPVPVSSAQESGKPAPPTWVHDIFQGTLTNETRCLCCETVTARDESFLDLSLDIEQNSSVTACLRNFSSTETLSGNDKFFCDKCCSLQEAEKRMRIKALPRVLALHLKRFKYIEQLGRYKKLSYRVVFPHHLRLCNTVDDAPGAEAEYSLFAVIVHVGSGPNHGHYISMVKSHNHWLYFDDETVESIEDSYVQNIFGSSQEFAHNNTDHGYFLFYECLQPELLRPSSSSETKV